MLNTGLIIDITIKALIMSLSDTEKFNPLGPVTDVRTKMREKFVQKRMGSVSRYKNAKFSTLKPHLEEFKKVGPQFDEMCQVHNVYYSAQLVSLKPPDLSKLSDGYHGLFFDALQLALDDIKPNSCHTTEAVQRALGMIEVEGDDRKKRKFFPEDRLKAALYIANVYRTEFSPQEKAAMLDEEHPYYRCFNLEFDEGFYEDNQAELRQAGFVTRDKFNDAANHIFPIRYVVAKAFNDARAKADLIGLSSGGVQSSLPCGASVVVTEEGQEILRQNYQPAYIVRLLSIMQREVSVWTQDKDIVALCSNPERSMG